MKLHDIGVIEIPDWVQNVACAWYDTYELNHMPLVFDPRRKALAYTRLGKGLENPDNEIPVSRKTWKDWEITHTRTPFDPTWVIVR